MQPKNFKPHPISMFWADTISLEFWTIPRYTAEMSELDDEASISYSEILIYSILPYEFFFLKEIRVCVQEGICSAQCGRFCLAWRLRTVKHKHTFFLLWTLPIPPVPLLPPFSLVHPATNRNDLAFGEKWKTCFLCQCTSARSYFICFQLNQITNVAILHWLIPSDLLYYTRYFLWWVNISFAHTIYVVKNIPNYSSSLCFYKEENW